MGNPFENNGWGNNRNNNGWGNNRNNRPRRNFRNIFNFHNPYMIMILLLLVMRVMRGGFSSFTDWLVTHLLMLPAIVVGLSFHEFGHAFVSDRLGDPLPRDMGRVTLNPLAHIDPVGFLALIFAGFGWGVPVQIDPRYYKHRRRDELLVAGAGVFMNLLIVIATVIILKLLVMFAPGMFSHSVGSIITDMLQYMIMINIVLMLFNLLPVPPLDGFNILTQIFDLQKHSWWYPLYRNGSWILLVMILFNVTSLILSPLVSALSSVCFKIIF
ncbi:MAG: site-2 protease family protein [Firmicutes bacterium]|nr:site-2 protease family protein [Bacillota bacterium]